MKRVFTHVGVSVWLYIDNMIFPAQPMPFQPEEQILSYSGVLEPASMLEDLRYLVDTVESVHPDRYARIGEEEWSRRKDALEAMLTGPLSAAQYYFALGSLITSVGDAHTILRFEETDKGLALTSEWVEEGLVIAEDYGRFQEGDLVPKIGDQSPSGLLDRLDGIVSSENNHRVRDESGRHLRRRPVLADLALTGADKREYWPLPR